MNIEDIGNALKRVKKVMLSIELPDGRYDQWGFECSNDADRNEIALRALTLHVSDFVRQVEAKPRPGGDAT